MRILLRCLLVELMADVERSVFNLARAACKKEDQAAAARGSWGGGGSSRGTGATPAVWVREVKTEVKAVVKAEVKA